MKDEKREVEAEGGGGGGGGGAEVEGAEGGGGEVEEGGEVEGVNGVTFFQWLESGRRTPLQNRLYLRK